MTILMDLWISKNSFSVIKASCLLLKGVNNFLPSVFIDL